jgi:hypothetical protein
VPCHRSVRHRSRAPQVTAATPMPVAVSAHRQRAAPESVLP